MAGALDVPDAIGGTDKPVVSSVTSAMGSSSPMRLTGADSTSDRDLTIALTELADFGTSRNSGSAASRSPDVPASCNPAFQTRP